MCRPDGLFAVKRLCPLLLFALLAAACAPAGDPQPAAPPAEEQEAPPQAFDGGGDAPPITGGAGWALSTGEEQFQQIPVEPPPIFAEVSTAALAAADVEPIDDPTVVRVRYAEFSIDVVNENVLSPAADALPAEPVTLNLFDDVAVTLTTEQVQQLTPEIATWTGTVQGQTPGEATFVVKDGIITGNVTVNDTVFEIRPAGSNLQSIAEIDQSQFGEDLETEAPDLDTSSSESGDVEGAASDTSTGAPDPAGVEGQAVVDLLVVYTPQAKAAVNDIETEITLAVQATNTSFEKSGINELLRLVHSSEVEYQDSGWVEDDRNALQDPGDGAMDEVHSLRKQYGADVVILMVEDGGKDHGKSLCGMSFIMDDPRAEFAAYAFAVVVRKCATSNFSLAHELGHLMGARHDWKEDATDNSPFTFNHGYVAPSMAWRTIMAYATACKGSTAKCLRVPRWSNPELQWDGQATGIDAAQEHAADNRRTLNATAAMVAGFQGSAGCGGEISYGATVSGIIAFSGQECSYSFHGEAGTTVTVEMVHLADGLDPYLELRDPNGQVEAADDDSGGERNSVISEHILLQSGEYTVAARGYGDSSGPFSLAADRVLKIEQSTWSMVGYDAGNTHWNNQEALLAPPLQEAWHFAPPDGVDYFESAAIAQGVVVLSSATGGQKGYAEIALDAETGAYLWRFDLPGEGGGSVGISPAIADDLVFFGGQNDDNLYAVDLHTGELRWSRPGMVGMWDRDPILAGGMLYVSTWGGLPMSILALNPETGAAQWELAGESRQSDYVFDNGVLMRAGVYGEELTGIDAGSGILLWRTPGKSPAHLAAWDGLVFAAYTGDAPAQLSDYPYYLYDRVAAFSVQDGAKLWETYIGDELTYGQFAVVDGELYMLSWPREGSGSKLYVLDPHSGAVLNEQKLDASYRRLVAANSVLYLCGDGLVALQTDTLQSIWQPDLWACGDIAVANRSLYVVQPWSAGLTVYR